MVYFSSVISQNLPTHRTFGFSEKWRQHKVMYSSCNIREPLSNTSNYFTVTYTEVKRLFIDCPSELDHRSKTATTEGVQQNTIHIRLYHPSFHNNTKKPNLVRPINRESKLVLA